MKIIIEFEENGKLLFTAKKEYHEEYFITMNKLLGLKKIKSYSFVKISSNICRSVDGVRSRVIVLL